MNSTNRSVKRGDYLPLISETVESNCQTSTPKRRVASWGDAFDTLLNDPIGLTAFTEFLKQEFSEENIKFWLEANAFSKLKDNKKILKEANSIYNKYVSVKAENPVNIDSKARHEAEIKLKNPNSKMFEASEKQIYNLMKSDSYRRFLDSDLYSNYLEYEMQNSYPFNDKRDIGSIHRRELRRSIVPWQRAKQFKPRLSLPGSSARKLVSHLSRLRSVKKLDNKVDTDTSLSLSRNTKESLKMKKDCLKTPPKNKTIKDETIPKDQHKVSNVKYSNPCKSQLSSTVDNLIEATNSDISFSDDTKSEAFFSDLILMSQKVPIDTKPPLPSNTGERSLMELRNRKSVLIESQVAFFPTAYVSKSKIYV